MAHVKTNACRQVFGVAGSEGILPTKGERSSFSRPSAEGGDGWAPRLIGEALDEVGDDGYSSQPTNPDAETLVVVSSRAGSGS